MKPFFVGCALLAALIPSWANQDAPEPSIGRMHIQTFAPMEYCYGSIETDFKGMVQPLGKFLGDIGKAAEEGKVKIRGPVMHVYYDSPHLKPDQRFKMETGFKVLEGAKPGGNLKIRKTPRFKGATMLYVGPGKRIGDAWQKLAAAVAEARLTPTGEERELYLYWESDDSPNNVVQVQMGVK